MKKIVLLFLAFVLIIPAISYAASISGAETILSGSTNKPGFFSLKRLSIGVDNDYVFGRDLKVTNWAKDYVSTGFIPGGGWARQLHTQDIGTYTKPKIDRLYRTTAKINYALFKNLDIFVKLGSANLKLRDEGLRGSFNNTLVVTGFPFAPTTILLNNGDLDYDTDNVFVWGVGFKAIYNLAKDWLIGIDAQYLRHKHDYDAASLETVTIIGGPGNNAIYESWSGTLTLYEWQIAPYLAKKVGKFTPYLGVKYSDLRIKDQSQVGYKYYITIITSNSPFIDVGSSNYTKKYKAIDHVGPFVGLDYNIGKHWKLNIEGRFVDETAISGNISYKF